MGNETSRQGAIDEAKTQARNLAQNLKDVGGNLSEGLSELQESAVCSSARTGVESLDCCGADRSGSALAHRFDLPDDAQAQPVSQRNQPPKERKKALGKKHSIPGGESHDNYTSRSTLAGHSNGESSTASQRPAPAGDSNRYGLGILWLTRNSKLICAGFAPGSPAKTAGVKSGDILKSVNGTDILQMKVDGKTGKHAAGELMIGSEGTTCALQLLRVQPAAEGQGSEQVKLNEISVTVPRMLKAGRLERESWIV